MVLTSPFFGGGPIQPFKGRQQSFLNLSGGAGWAKISLWGKVVGENYRAVRHAKDFISNKTKFATVVLLGHLLV